MRETDPIPVSCPLCHETFFVAAEVDRIEFHPDRGIWVTWERAWVDHRCKEPRR